MTFEQKLKEKAAEQETSAGYDAFVEKFKPKKTTDDCFTPPNIYAAVLNYVVEKYELHSATIVRPFYPGGDYKAESYPPNSVVIDNPPFSILSEIVRYYQKENIRFFLFAPTLTLFSTASGTANYVVCGGEVIYENGAKVNTSFVTNLGLYKIECDSKLFQIIKEQNKINEKAQKKQMRKLSLPDAVINAALISKFSKHGADFRIKEKDALFIRKIDNMNGGIFGGGFLLSEYATSERAAAERAAAERYELSEREKKLVSWLGVDDVL